MRVYVEEILPNGARFRFTVIVGSEKNGGELFAAELMEYKSVDEQGYIMVLPKAAQMSNEEKFIMRGTFMEKFVDENDEFVFEFPIAKVFRMRSEVWLKAETLNWQKVQEKLYENEGN